MPTLTTNTLDRIVDLPQATDPWSPQWPAGFTVVAYDDDEEDEDFEDLDYDDDDEEDEDFDADFLDDEEEEVAEGEADADDEEDL